MPRPAIALSLAAQVALASAVELTGEALWMPEARADDPGFGFGLTALSLGACLVAVGSPRVDLSTCGALWGGALHVVIYELQPVSPGDSFWAAASAAPRLRLRIAPRVRTEIGMHLIVPLARRPFLVRGWNDPVFEQTPVTAIPFVGVGVGFP